MARKMKINEKTVAGILKGEKTAADLLRRAKNIAVAGGPGMEASVVIGRNRARASVITATRGARRAEATRRALSNAIDAGRL